MMGVISALTMTAQDFDYEYMGQTLTYTVLDEEARSVSVKAGYNNEGDLLVIPASVAYGEDIYTVTSIENRDFIRQICIQ